MYDAHVQAWVRDRVVVLEMLAELRRLVELRERREYKARHKAYSTHLEAKRVAVRTDGEVVYLSGGVRVNVSLG